MFRSNKWWLLLIGLVVLGLALAACRPAAVEPTATAEPPPTEVPPTKVPPIRIAVFNPVLGNSYTDAVTRGVRDTAAELGGEVTIDVFGAEYDAVAQNNQIEDAIVAGYDALVIYAVDGNAVIPAVEDAVEAGLVVVGADVPIGPDPRVLEPCCGMTAMVGLTGYRHGTYLSEMIIMACEEAVGAGNLCKVGYINGVQALTIDQERVAAVTDVLAEHAEIEIVSMQEAFYLQDQGYTVAQNMLQANPDINVLASPGDQMMLGAEQAVIDAGLEGKIVLNGNGASEQGYQAVKEGRWFATFAHIPYTIGLDAGEIAIKTLRGEKDLPTFVDAGERIPPLPASTGPIITQESADEFEPQW